MDPGCRRRRRTVHEDFPAAIGGLITTIEGYRIHTFLESGIFTVVQDLTGVELLVVGEGGAGGNSQHDSNPGFNGGGGGAGGMVEQSDVAMAIGDYTITVGAGTLPGYGAATTGKASSISGIATAPGGGGGGGFVSHAGVAGGSGGGGAATAGANEFVDGAWRWISPPGGVGTAGQGNDGGHGCGSTTGVYTIAASGGGAGAPGVNGVNDTRPYAATASTGGIGKVSSISGEPVYYAGGGGGAFNDLGDPAPGSALGGGGRGKASNYASTAGTPNTGGGGGGDSFASGGSGKAGGSGIVIVRYPI